MTTVNMTKDDPMADSFSKEMRLHVAKLSGDWACEAAMVFADEVAADRRVTLTPGLVKWECALDCGAVKFPVWVVTYRLRQEGCTP